MSTIESLVPFSSFSLVTHTVSSMISYSRQIPIWEVAMAAEKPPGFPNKAIFPIPLLSFHHPLLINTCTVPISSSTSIYGLPRPICIHQITKVHFLCHTLVWHSLHISRPYHYAVFLFTHSITSLRFCSLPSQTSHTLLRYSPFIKVIPEGAVRYFTSISSILFHFHSSLPYDEVSNIILCKYLFTSTLISYP